MKTRATHKPSTITTKRKPRKSPAKSPQQSANFAPVVFVTKPLCTQEQYAADTGLPEGVVRGHVEKKLLPTKKVGRHRMINLAKLTQQCLEAGHDA